MGNYSELKDIINNPTSHGLPRWDNGDNRIEGETMKSYLLALVNSLSSGGYLFAGVAKLTPTQTDPGTPDQNVFYIAAEPGSYTNFPISGGYLQVADGEVAIFKFNGQWSKETTGAATASQVNQLGQEIDRRMDAQDEEIADFKEAVQDQVDNYPMITINGNVTNAPDEEDITSVEENGSEVLKFKNRSAVDGMGYVILRKGGNSTFANQVTAANTIYEIRYDFALEANFTMPANCVLKFNGGSIGGAYTLTGNNTKIDAELEMIFGVDLIVSGTWDVDSAFPEWFGACGGNIDDNIAIKKCGDSFGFISLTGEYTINDTIAFRSTISIIGIPNITKMKAGADNLVMLDLSNNSTEKIYLSGVSFFNEDSHTNVTAVLLGAATNLFALNVIVEKCAFSKIETAIFLKQECDNITIQDNYFVWCGCSVYSTDADGGDLWNRSQVRILNNQLQNNYSDHNAIDLYGVNDLSVEHNLMQGSNRINFAFVNLRSCNQPVIRDNYLEISASADPSTVVGIKLTSVHSPEISSIRAQGQMANIVQLNYPLFGVCEINRLAFTGLGGYTMASHVKNSIPQSSSCTIIIDGGTAKPVTAIISSLNRVNYYEDRTYPKTGDSIFAARGGGSVELDLSYYLTISRMVQVSLVSVPTGNTAQILLKPGVNISSATLWGDVVYSYNSTTGKITFTNNSTTLNFQAYWQAISLINQ